MGNKAQWSKPVQKITEVEYIERNIPLNAGIGSSLAQPGIGQTFVGSGLGSGLNSGLGSGLNSGIGSNLGTGFGSGIAGQPGLGGANLIGLPHVRVNPECKKCYGTAWNSTKGRECRKCVCHKCGGSGFNATKNMPCKKLKTGLL